MDSVKATKASDFEIVFDATLVRGMSYYTGTIFEIAMPEFGGSCGGGGRYDKMVGKSPAMMYPPVDFHRFRAYHHAAHGERIQSSYETEAGSIPDRKRRQW